MTLEPRGPVRSGFEALRQGKLILLLAVTTVALGLIAAMPLAAVFQSDFAGTLVGDHFIRNSPLAPTDFVDFVERKTDAIHGARRTASAAGVLGVLLQAFFAGGIVVVLGRGPFAFGQFVEPARRNLGHNVKCLLLFVVALVVVVGGWFGGAIAASRTLLENAPPDSFAHRASWWATLLIGLLLFAVLSLVYDFARAARRYAPTIGAWRSVRFAWRVLGGVWLRALALFGFWLVLGALAVVAGVGRRGGCPRCRCRRWRCSSSCSSRARAAVGRAGRDPGLLPRLPGSARAARPGVPDLVVGGRRPYADWTHSLIRRTPSRIRSVFEAYENRTHASSPNASPGTAATCASERSLSQNPTDPFTDSAG
jgi:hypothetical protein